VIDLAFSVAGARAERYSASPTVVLRLRVAERNARAVEAIALKVQIQLETQRRAYAPAESELLEELFGKPARYGETLKPMLWTHVSQMVLAFEAETEFDLPIPCSYDFDVAASKYLASLEEGTIPLDLLFSGMAFTRGAQNGELTPEFVSWSCEARYRLPVAIYREAMDACFPNEAWIRVHRDTFEELRRFKIAAGLTTWDAVIERLTELGKLRS
jgi:hypothetical protein